MNQKRLALIFMVFIVAVAGYVGASTAATSVEQQASVTVNPIIALSGAPTITFDPVADSTAGSSPRSFNNVLTDGSNMPIDVYTRANDTKMVAPGTTDVITPIQFTTQTGVLTDYTTGYQMAYANWPKPPQGSTSPATWTQVLNIVVPSYTNNGTYVVTIYNAAVASGAAAPTTP